MIKILFLLIVVGGAGVYFFPGFNEKTSGPCLALEKRIDVMVQEKLKTLPPSADPRLTAALNAVRSALPTGNLADSYVHERFPALPPEIGCVGAYWKLTLDPDVVKFTSGALPALQKKG